MAATTESPPPPPSSSQWAGSIRRILALVLRNIYLMRTSWPRVLELVYWPTMSMVLWGFITSFFIEHSSWVAQAASVLISAVLLWDVLFRSNLGVALGFLEEVWSRNLGQLFVSPLRPGELIGALMTMSLLRTVISVAPAALMALPLFDVWIFDLGPPLMAFYANLVVMGWWLGLFCAGTVLRFGLGAESLAWVVVFLMAPLSGIYYPIDSLPPWVQGISWMLPSAYVFEGMRTVLFDDFFRSDLLLGAVALNGVYLSASCGYFLFMVKIARRRGQLLQQGE